MLRAFIDSSGTEWRVWDVLPSPTNRAFAASPGSLPTLNGTAFASGWLCFESAMEKRRLAPIPKDWNILRDSELERMCSGADVVSDRRRPRAS